MFEKIVNFPLILRQTYCGTYPDKINYYIIYIIILIIYYYYILMHVGQKDANYYSILFYLDLLGSHERKSEDFLVGRAPRLARDLLEAGW